MRTFRLIRAAIDAQIMLARSAGRRLARQAAMLLTGATFGVFALGFLHVTIYFALEGAGGIAPVFSALIIAGGDTLICLIALILARSGAPDAQTIEARLVRDRAMSDLRNGLAIATVAGPAGRIAGRGVAGAVRRLFARRRSSRRS